MVTSTLLEGRPGRVGELTLRYAPQGVLVLGPESGDGSPEAPTDPELFRRWIRETEGGQYRPLSGARSLRRNWIRPSSSIDEAVAVVDLVYPLALRHRQLHRSGRLRTAGWDEVIGRQRGQYAAAGRLRDEARAVAREVLCAACVRSPVWAGTDPEGGPEAIPCPEPCGVLLALGRAAAGWEQRPPERVPPDGRVRAAEFDLPGNAIREAYLARRAENGHPS